MRCYVSVAVLLAILVGPVETSRAINVRTERIMTGLNQPLGLITTPSDDRHLFVMERNGRIRAYDQQTGRMSRRIFLDIRDRVNAGQDGGLVGAAFDPNFADNGYVYVQYTDRSSPRPNNRLSRFTLREDVLALDPLSEEQILYVEQPHTAHNGNWIGFGPDGMLYYTLGDGGNQHDPNNSGQDTSTLLGSVLRIDVGRDDFPGDPDANYGIPTDNPFVGRAGRDEIWAHGLRNPWRASFDRLTGDFYIGDTSQDTWEEVNFIAASSSGGENFGWRLREGFEATPTGNVGGPKTPEMVDPVYAYHHGNGRLEGNSVIGGYVYRGPIQSDDVQGQYFFTDWVTNRVWSIEVDPRASLMVQGSIKDWTSRLRPDVGSLTQISSQGEDNQGNLYFISLGGDIFKLTADPPLTADFDGDGDVDRDDLHAWQASFGTASGATPSEGDANGDGAVSGSDFLAWQRELGALQAAAATPEPSSGVMLLCLASVGILWRRRVAPWPTPSRDIALAWATGPKRRLGTSAPFFSFFPRLHFSSTRLA